MTDDLVKRLRKVEPDAPGERTRWYRNPDGPEAADLIEALRSALRWYAENCAANGDKIEGPSGDYGQRARAALEGKIYGEDAEK